MDAQATPETVESAKHLFTRRGHASVSMLQREFKLGYQAALSLMEAVRRQAGAEQHGLDRPDLPIETALFPENRLGGLLLCGINDGLTSAEAHQDAAGIDRSAPFRSFFSDERVQDTRFRNTIVKWFSHWGYHLQGDWRLAQGLDRALVHTNWLMSATNNVGGIDVRRACIDDPHPFLNLCEELRPGLIIFFSKQLMSAFTSGELRPRVEVLFGASQGDTDWFQADVPNVKAFKVGIHRFEQLTTISLPHPTGSRGISDDYIEALMPRLRKEINAWWEPHWSQVSSHSVRSDVPA